MAVGIALEFYKGKPMMLGVREVTNHTLEITLQAAINHLNLAIYLRMVCCRILEADTLQPKKLLLEFAEEDGFLIASDSARIPMEFIHMI